MKLWRIAMTLGRSHSDLQRISQSLAEPLGTMISKTKEENREYTKQRENTCSGHPQNRSLGL